MERQPHWLARLALLAVIWLGTGFALGTLTLLGPVRWTTSVLRANAVPEIGEKIAVLTLIALLVMVSFGLSYVLTLRAVAATRWWRGAVFPVLTTAAAGLALWGWLTPGLINRGAQAEVLSGTRFTFGPYPTAEDLARLKAEGFTDVISLLHPAVVPFEPRLLNQELEAAEAVGINVIHVPMLPWLSDNESSIARLRSIIAEGDGKYYVHCYLGRDRVGAVRRLVRQLSPDAEGGLLAASDTPEHPLAGKEALERGRVLRLDDHVYLTPYPTDEEFLAYVLQEATGAVVSMLDPSRPSDVKWIEKEREALSAFAVPFVSAPVPSDPFEPERVLELVERVRAMEGTVIVHAFLDGSPAFQAFAQAYRTGRAPLPPALFAESMQGGRARVVAPAVAVGPQPSGWELEERLPRAGVRGLVHLGTVPPALDRAALERSGLGLTSLSDEDGAALYAVLRAGGPWYVFGDSVQEVLRVVSTLGLDPLPGSDAPVTAVQ